MSENEVIVTLPAGRYSQLLDTETRVDVAVEYIRTEEYPNWETLLRILHTPEAVQTAKEMEEKKEREHEEYLKKHGGKIDLGIDMGMEDDNA